MTRHYDLRLTQDITIDSVYIRAETPIQLTIAIDANGRIEVRIQGVLVAQGPTVLKKLSPAG